MPDTSVASKAAKRDKPELNFVRTRNKLKPRREPYWHRVQKGCYLGFRKVSKDTDGTWLARAYMSTDGQQKYHPLGDFSQHPDFERFDKALEKANEWFSHIGKGGSPDVFTIRDACDRYVKHLRRNGQDETALDAEQRFKRYVLEVQSFADLELRKATPMHFEQWRDRMMARPTEQGLRSGGKRKKSKAELERAAARAAEVAKRVRAKSTLNRDMTSFRAALNLALEDGLVTTNFAWKGKLKPLDNVERSRELYIDAKERRELVGACPPDAAKFFSVLNVLPLRPGALAKLTVGNYERRLKVLTIGPDVQGRATDKNHAPRSISLPPAISVLFDRAVRSRLPYLPLFPRENGKAWNSDSWKVPMKAAVEAANLPKGTTVYTIRHSVITDLVIGGLNLLTVAQLAGTSIAMIEKHYGHLVKPAAEAALAQLAQKA